MARPDYIEKLDFIGGIDPYTLKESDFDAFLDEIPKISRNIILNYFLFRVSPSTYFEIRACKSLDAFAQLACKWIESICAKKLNDNFVIIGKFAGTRTDEKSVTDVLAYWIGPSKKGQFCKRLEDIDFTTPIKLLMSNSEETHTLKSSQVPSSSKSEMDSFTKKMIDLGLMPAYAICKEEFNPSQTLDEKFPKSLLTLHEERYVERDLEELRNISRSILVNVTVDQALAVFEATTKQSEEKQWFEIRAGRITASKFKSAFLGQELRSQQFL